ncbi:MAG: hypothetical protein AAF938_14015 [Myxococcota bacterium]
MARSKPSQRPTARPAHKTAAPQTSMLPTVRPGSTARVAAADFAPVPEAPSEPIATHTDGGSGVRPSVLPPPREGRRSAFEDVDTRPIRLIPRGHQPHETTAVSPNEHSHTPAERVA